MQQVLTAMLSYGMMPVGGGAPALLGGTVWNSRGDDVTQDEEGMKSARLLGARMGLIDHGEVSPWVLRQWHH